MLLIVSTAVMLSVAFYDQGSLIVGRSHLLGPSSPSCLKYLI